MSTSDIIAIGVLVVCILLGMLGFFKCLSRFISGFIVGMLILFCISAWADHPVFDKYSQSVFQGSKVFSFLKQQTSKLKDSIHNQWPNDNVQSKYDNDTPLEISLDYKIKNIVSRAER